MAGLAGADLRIYAAEDIYTADHQGRCRWGRGELCIFTKDALVATVTTDADGYATRKEIFH